MLADPSRAAVPARPLPTQASVTIINADLRTRQLAEAMVRLNAEGEATEAALLREGFSRYELQHLAEAARGVANTIFVRVEQEPPPPSDEDLIELSFRRAVARQSIDPLQLRTIMRGIYITDDVAARIWPKLCARLARHVALMPIPGVAG